MPHVSAKAEGSLDQACLIWIPSARRSVETRERPFGTQLGRLERLHEALGSLLAPVELWERTRVPTAARGESSSSRIAGLPLTPR